MADPARRTANLIAARNVVGALATLFSGLLGFAVLVDAPLAVKVALAGMGLLGLFVAVVLSVLEFRAHRRAEQAVAISSVLDEPPGQVLAGPSLTKPPKRWRSWVWLATLSVVVAFAMGMFTLRSHILLSEDADAQASVNRYEHSVAVICSALNRDDRAAPTDAQVLVLRLLRARTTLDERNAVLDIWSQVLAKQDHELASFEALEVPAPLATRARATVAAWDRIDARLRIYVQRLAAATGGREFIAAVRTLPAIRTAIAGDRVRSAAGLIELSAGRCKRNAPIATHTITLPGTFLDVTPGGTSTSSAKLPFTGLGVQWLLLAAVTLFTAGTSLRCYVQRRS